MTARQRLGAMVAAVMIAFATILLTGGPAQAASPFKITRVYYNSPGSDNFTNSSINGEYVIVRNISTGTQSLSGWRVMDANRHVYTFPTTTLASGASIVVRTGLGGNSSTTRYWQMTNYVWNNTGDTAHLFTPGGTLMHSCGYRDPSQISAYRNC